MKLFKLPVYFWCNVFGEIREMPQWVNASLFLALWAFFGKNHDIFMAAICDMALGRLDDHGDFLGIVHDWIKMGFMRKKEASSYIQMVFIVCCLLLTAPNKGHWFKCVVLISFCTCDDVHITINMWDRLLIKCDWLLTLESKKQISLWHVYLYISGSDQVSAMHPPPHPHPPKK